MARRGQGRPLAQQAEERPLGPGANAGPSQEGPKKGNWAGAALEGARGGQGAGAAECFVVRVRAFFSENMGATQVGAEFDHSPMAPPIVHPSNGVKDVLWVQAP